MNRLNFATLNMCACSDSEAASGRGLGQATANKAYMSDTDAQPRLSDPPRFSSSQNSSFTSVKALSKQAQIQDIDKSSSESPNSRARSPAKKEPTYSNLPSLSGLRPNVNGSDYDLVPEFIDFSLQFSADAPLRPQKFPPADEELAQQSEDEGISTKIPEGLAQKISAGTELANLTTGASAETSQSQAGSQGSRQSSGIHVTPSPSDSGIAELEVTSLSANFTLCLFCGRSVFTFLRGC